MNASTRIYDNTLALQYGSRLDGEKLRRIVEAKSVDDAFKMLADYGFSYSPDGTIDGFIIGETNKLIEFICESCDDRAIKALTREFLYNNVKLAYKSRFVEVPEDGYYAMEGFDAQKITKGDYSDCDGALIDALEELDERGERSPRVIDLVLTRAMYRDVLSCGIPSIVKYFRAAIDMTNILTAARLYRLGSTKTDEFIAGGRIKEDDLIEAAGGKNFALCFYGTPYEDMATSLENSDFKALGVFERESDDHLFYMTDFLAADMNSFRPFLNYYTRARIELKTLKAALVCVKTDARDSFYARRPDIYA